MKFIADCMLGKLVKQLRMLGYDTVYYRGEDPYPMIQRSRQENRIILTRNSKIVPKRSEDKIVRLKENYPLLQLKELIQMGYISLNEDNLFSRCLICNVIIDNIHKEEVEGKVPDFIFHQYKEFYQCSQCGRIYWQGTHQRNMEKKVRELFQL